MKWTCAYAVALSSSLLIAGTVAATLRTVPFDYGEIQAALDASSVNDRIEVSQKDVNNSPYAAITMVKGVTVIAVSGRPKIWCKNSSNQATAYAVSFPSDASTATILQGFTILGTSDITGTHIVEGRAAGIINDCIIDANGSTKVGLVGLYHTGASQAQSEDITILMNGTNQTRYGMYLDGSTFYCVGGRIDIHGSGSNYGILCPTGVGTGGPRIEQFLVKVPNGTGIEYDFTETGPAAVKNCTVDSTTGFCIKVGGHTNLTNCIGTNSSGGNEISGPFVTGVEYVKDCIAYPTGFEENDHIPPSDPTKYGNIVEDPRYCDPVHGEYTLRVDSYGNPDVALNKSADTGVLLALGTFPVACAYGTLSRSGLVWGGGDDFETTPLNVTGDWAIPNNKTFTLDYGGILSMSDSDAMSSTGSYTGKDEILVSGTFNVSGQSSNKAKIQAASTPSEGKWGTISFSNGGAGTISYCEIRDATVGVRAKYDNSLYVTNCLFEGNQVMDIDLKAGSSNYHVTDNTILVGGGIGIKYESTSTTIDPHLSNNTVTLNSDSESGFQLWGSGPLYAISNNTISGAYAGFGMDLCGLYDWLIQTNDISNCAIGVKLHRGFANGQVKLNGTIGGTSSGLGNSITNCTTGISADSSKVKTKIRYNDINNNGRGVTAKNGALPDVGSGSGGKNAFLNNSPYCIENRNTGTDTLLAMRNFFGSTNCDTTGGGVLCAYGPINLTGTLCSDPSSFALVAIGPRKGGALEILGAVPNPMRVESEIRFTLWSPASVHVQIFNLSGRLVRDLGVFALQAGTHSAAWDGLDVQGARVGTGIYLARITSGDVSSATTKILVSR